MRVTGELLVEEDATLTIAAPARVEFEGYHALSILGRVLAVGAPERRIVFTTADPGGFVADTTTAGGWAGIRFPNTSSARDSSRFEYCTIEYAKGVETRRRGGAFHFYNFSKAEIVNCAIRRNVAFYGAGVFCSNGASPRITGCLFTENRAFLEGSAAHAIDAFPKLVNCTAAGNEILNQESFWATATIHNHIAKIRVANCILWDNTSHYFIPTELRESKAYYTTDSDIERGFPGEGNIDLDPLFDNDEDAPHRLRADSPCVDAGSLESETLGLPGSDLWGVIRVYGGRVDMGAYEWVAPAGIPGNAAARGSVACHPNPFHDGVSMRIRGLGRGVRLAIVDAGGRLVRRVEGRASGTGDGEFDWDGKDGNGRRVAPGVYLIRIEGAGEGRAPGRVVRVE